VDAPGGTSLRRLAKWREVLGREMFGVAQGVSRGSASLSVLDWQMKWQHTGA
jgi:hypothetical protein